MTRGYITPHNLEKWLYQNKTGEIEDSVEGCLLDNFIVQAKNGIIAIYEHYLNANLSNYYFEYARSKDNASLALLYKNWDKFRNDAECIEC